MDLNQVLRDESMQLAILGDAIAEFEELEDHQSDLIGHVDPVSAETTESKADLSRPIAMVTLMASEQSDPSAPQSSLDDLKAVAAPGAAWWERTWIILTIIFVSPTFRAALWAGGDIQKEWLRGGDTTSSFKERFETYICGNKSGAIAVTPLEAVVEEITLWELLNS